VWVATSDDVPGLVTEPDTLESFSVKLEALIPELLDLNGVPNGEEVPFEFLARKFSVTQRNLHQMGISFSIELKRLLSQAGC
jgi:hypothetical protein